MGNDPTGDVMWWDSVYDLAFLRYPPFGEMTSQRWSERKI
jgi:hypothetical protein